MDTSDIFFKARRTILQMFQDRGYEGDFIKFNNLSATDLSSFNLFTASDATPNKTDNAWIDLWGFYEKRYIHIQKTVQIPNPSASKPNESPTISKFIDEIETIKVPVYVHFTSKPKPKKNGGLKRIDLYKNLLENEEVGKWLKDSIDKYEILRNVVKTKDPKTWVHKLMDEEVMSGVHMMIVYNGWDYAQNKVPKDLFYVYQSSENSPIVYDLEIWPAHTLVTNITDHVLVPKHTLLSIAEKTNFLIEEGEFYLNPTDKEKIKDMSPLKKERYLENYFFQIMQKISLYDPVNLYYYGRLRQIYKIVRGGKSVTYRIVKKSPLLQDQRK